MCRLMLEVSPTTYDVVAVRRDAMDPQFMANLSKLGPVSINDAGRFIRT